MSNPVVSFDEQAVKDELRELVGETIEATINALLDEEADQLVGAGPHERTDDRAAYRAGPHERGFTTTSGQVTLETPKLKDEVRNRRHRALQKARDLGRGGHHRDAPGRRVDAAHRGRQRDPVGRRRLRRHGLQSQRQGVQGR